MTRDDYLILLIETVLGTTVFYSLFTIAGWENSERLFFGAIFLAVMFAIEKRGSYSDEQHLQILRVMATGFSSNKTKFPEELETTLKQARFERETGLQSFGIFTLLLQYALWFGLAWVIQRFWFH